MYTTNFFCDRMVSLVVAIWISLFMTSQSKVITVNNGDNFNISCCIHEACICGSLSTALWYLENNTVIDITSQPIPLHGHVAVRSLNNVTYLAMVLPLCVTTLEL